MLSDSRNIQFKNVRDLNRDIVQWLPSLPRDVDLIVGVPRSGILPATLLALYLHKPLASLDQYVNGNTMHSGERLNSKMSFSVNDPSVSVLVVDDCVRSGTAMQKAKKFIEHHVIKNEIQYGTVYVTPRCKSIVDHYYEVLPEPRVWEWNIMYHHLVLRQACMDIDGVLCRDPTDKEDDDGPRYREFLRTVKPLFKPTRVPIKCLVTNRLEKYRALTEKWLRQHDIKYDRLVMMDLPSQEARRASNHHVEHKVKAYLDSGAFLFIESERWQAEGIARAAAKPVYCVNTGEMLQPDTLDSKLRQKTRGLWHLTKVTVKMVRRNPAMLPQKIVERIKRSLKNT